MLSQQILSTTLQDDSTSIGGISHVDETVQEFIDSVNIKPKNLDELNQALTSCGIKPIH